MVLSVTTGFACVLFRTGAVEVVTQAVAGSLILTWVGVTRVGGRPTRNLTELPREAEQALAHEAVQHRVAATAVQTGPTGTLVPLELTVCAHKARRALAVVTPRPCPACCSIPALSMATIHFYVTVLSGPAFKAVAVISANQVFARVCIYTWLSHTLISIYLTGLPSPLWRAHTLKSILHVNTRSSLGTRTGSTLVHVTGTGGALPARGAVALKARWTLVARASVGTGVGHAGMLGYVAGLSRVAIGADALILVRLRVHTGAPVGARLVAATVVQVFVAQEASPVRFTVTLPGGDAGAVNTSRVGHTLVTELALPAIVTLAFPRDRAASM